MIRVSKGGSGRIQTVPKPSKIIFLTFQSCTLCVYHIIGNISYTVIYSSADFPILCGCINFSCFFILNLLLFILSIYSEYQTAKSCSMISIFQWILCLKTHILTA